MLWLVILLLLFRPLLLRRRSRLFFNWLWSFLNLGRLFCIYRLGLMLRTFLNACSFLSGLVLLLWFVFLLWLCRLLFFCLDRSRLFLFCRLCLLYRLFSLCCILRLSATFFRRSCRSRRLLCSRSRCGRFFGFSSHRNRFFLYCRFSLLFSLFCSRVLFARTSSFGLFRLFRSLQGILLCLFIENSIYKILLFHLLVALYLEIVSKSTQLIDIHFPQVKNLVHKIVLSVIYF